MVAVEFFRLPTRAENTRCEARNYGPGSLVVDGYIHNVSMGRESSGFLGSVSTGRRRCLGGCGFQSTKLCGNTLGGYRVAEKYGSS